MSNHLGYEAYAPEGRGTGNSRNGKTKKTVQSDAGQFEIEVPRDREGSFEPQLVRKRQRRLDGFDDKVLALYARGLSTREIQAQLEELYGVEVSPALISYVTNAVYEEVRAWQSRPLAALGARDTTWTRVPRMRNRTGFAAHLHGARLPPARLPPV